MLGKVNGVELDTAYQQSKGTAMESHIFAKLTILNIVELLN